MQRAEKTAKSAADERGPQPSAERAAAPWIYADRRAEAAPPRQQREMIAQSPRMTAQRQHLRSLFGEAVQLQEALEDEKPVQGRSPSAQRQTAEEEDEPLEGQFERAQRQGAEEDGLQRQSSTAAAAQLEPHSPPPRNRTGLPDRLKTGIESLSGIAMDPVRVHFNSPQPAQLNALAYAKGCDIHVAPGQEQHLPHEAWHVVQQLQGRVPTTSLINGVPVNDDLALEQEADVMGAKATEAAVRGEAPIKARTDSSVVQSKTALKDKATVDQQGWPASERLSSGEVRQLGTEEGRPIQGVFTAGQKEKIKASLSDLLEEPTIEEIILMAELAEKTYQPGIEAMVYNLVRSKNLSNPIGLHRLLKQIVAATYEKTEEVAYRDGSGFVFELYYATKKAMTQKYSVQLGTIDSIGGDIVLTNKDNDAVTTLHLKYLTGQGTKAVKSKLVEAMGQFGGSGGELPEKGSLRKILVVVENTKNPVAVESEESVVKLLLGYLNNTPKNINVDEVEVIANVPGVDEHRIFKFTSL